MTVNSLTTDQLAAPTSTDYPPHRSERRRGPRVPTGTYLSRVRGPGPTRVPSLSVLDSKRPAEKKDDTGLLIPVVELGPDIHGGGRTNPSVRTGGRSSWDRLKRRGGRRRAAVGGGNQGRTSSPFPPPSSTSFLSFNPPVRGRFFCRVFWSIINLVERGGSGSG